MPSSESRIARLLMAQEIRSLLGSLSVWIMLVILSLLVGYSFIQAVDLFTQASKTALAYPELASGMNPMEGIFVPTMGAYYLVETLLLPFVVIRLVGQDKQTGTLKLLLQLPLSPFTLGLVKLGALSVIGILFLIPGASAVIIWHFLGGTVYLPELSTLVFGHLLYILAIVCIAMFAAVVSSTLATAAMICLAVTLGSWVLDFAANSSPWAAVLSRFSLTTLLRQFESGLLSSTAIASLLAISLLFFFAASILLHPGHQWVARLKAFILVAIIIFVSAWGILQKPLTLDTTENHRHSFNPADMRALKEMKAPLKITVHMAHEDSRLYDFEHSILSKLRRTVPQLEIIYAPTQSTGLFGSPESDNYGLIEYNYLGKHDESYSTSAYEILPLLHALAGQKVSPDAIPPYTGHPLIADAGKSQWWFYLVLPLIFLISGFQFRHPQLLSHLFGGHSNEN
ncbi:MAG TPA: ABC transporter permease [Gammaproteobacteria bacterium]|nr:ABC transporter permease [Gammaproteobacteria bacterium]